jgi:WD40 repeat protein
MGKWKRQPPLTPEQLPSEIKQVERELEAVEQELAAEIAREEAIIEQELVPHVTPPAPGVITPTLPVPAPEPVPPTVCPPYIYVTEVDYADNTGTMYIIDPQKNELVKTVEMDQGVVLIDYDPASRRIYLTYPGNLINVFDVETGQLVAPIPLGEPAIFVGVDMVRNVLYISYLSSHYFQYITVYDLNTAQTIATVDIADPYEDAQYIWIEPQTGTVYILGFASPSFKIWKIDPDTYQVTLVSENVPLDSGFYFAAGDIARGKIYVLSADAPDTSILAVVNIHTGDAQIHEVPRTRAISIDERTGNIILFSQNKVYVVDPITFTSRLLATIDNGSDISPYTSKSIVYDNILYALTLDGTVYGYDLDTGAEVFQMALDVDTDNVQTYEFVVAPHCVEWPV